MWGMRRYLIRFLVLSKEQKYATTIHTVMERRQLSIKFILAYTPMSRYCAIVFNDGAES